jgi:uncharacterized protein (TIGR00251 family)
VSLPERPWLIAPNGIVVTIRLTPRGGRDAIETVERLADGRSVLKARVRAAASEGEANTALIKLVAKTLGVAPRDVSLVAGASARLKRLRVEGPGTTLAAALEKISVPNQSGAASNSEKRMANSE